MFKAIKTISPINGLSGEISFNQQGNRGKFKLEVLNLAREGLLKIGEWNSTTGLNIAQTNHRSRRSIDDIRLTNKTLIVLIAEVSE